MKINHLRIITTYENDNENEKHLALREIRKIYRNALYPSFPFTYTICTRD